MYKLALLARWSSPVILRYVAEAPLKTITTDCRRLLAGEELEAVVRDITKKAAHKDSDDANIKEAVGELDNRLRKIELNNEAAVVINLTTLVSHKVAFAQMGADRRLWSTRCGWHFAAGCAKFRVAPSNGVAAEHELCDRCHGRD